MKYIFDSCNLTDPSFLPRLIIYDPNIHENRFVLKLLCSLYYENIVLQVYSELDSSWSVTKLTTRVSLKRKFGETNCIN